MIYLHKILPAFLLPVGVTLIALLAGLFWRKKILIWVALIFLWICSTPVFSLFLMRATEGSAIREPASSAPKADAIVVLSGGRVVAPGTAAISEWEDADRFFGGLELFKAGKAPLLVFTGGWQPWQSQARPEGEVLIEYAMRLGVPQSQAVTTGKVFNTAEEAQAVARMLLERARSSHVSNPPPRILLVTSAFHMPRAKRLFERAGLEVVSFPVDFQAPERELSVIEFLPNARALEQTERALREIYGRGFYALN